MSEPVLAGAPLGRPPPKWADRTVALATVILLVGVCYSLWCGSALIWDGSYQLAYTIGWGKPYAYLSRFHTHIIWLPTAWLAWVCDDVRPLAFIYGAPFLLAPVVGFAVSWWFVRRHAPQLILWAAFGTLLTPLCGQIFVINDSIFQQHLFWPLLLGLMVPLSKSKWVVLSTLAIFQGVHQIGLVLSLGLSAAICLNWFVERRPEERRRLQWHLLFAIGLLALTGLKTWWISAPRPFLDYYDSYAAQEATYARIRESWLYGVDGMPLQGLICVYTAAVLLTGQWLASRAGRWTPSLALAGVAAICLMITAGLWYIWGSIPGFWASAINFRRWIVPVTLPIYILAVVEMLIRRSALRYAQSAKGAFPIETVSATSSQSAKVSTASGIRAVDRFHRLLDWLNSDEDGNPHPEWSRGCVIVRGGAILGAAILFCTVLDMQSHKFKVDSDRLQAEVMSGPHNTFVVPADHWLHVSPLWHWSTNWQVLLLQGKKPTRWIIGGDDSLTEQHLAHLEKHPPELPISSFTFQGAGPEATGWLDFGRVIENAKRDRAAQLPGTHK